MKYTHEVTESMKVSLLELLANLEQSFDEEDQGDAVASVSAAYRHALALRREMIPGA